DERERPVDPGRGVVADLDLDCVRLPPELLDHRSRVVDAGDADAASGERHRDPAGADRQLEGAARGERLEEVDRPLDRGRLEVRAGRLVVAFADVRVEPAHQPDLLSFPCRFACRSPALKTSSPTGVAKTAMISNGQTSAHATPVPEMIDARSPRNAYVAGEIFAIHCIHSGITVIG